MTTKICCICKKELDEERFYWRERTKQRRQAQCKKCLLEYQKQRWHNRKIQAIEYKGGVCVDCGQMPHWAAMQFHHLNPADKEFSWGKGRLKSWEKVKVELDKCVLLCANCHAVRHTRFYKHP